MLHLYRNKGRKLNFVFAPTGIFLLVLFSSLRASAQRRELNQIEHDEKLYYFGITLGMNVAGFHIDHHDQFLQSDSVQFIRPVNSKGFQLGLLATAKLGSRLELRFNPQLIFTERDLYYKLKYPDPAEESDSVTKKIESVITSFPLQLKFFSDRIGNFRVYVLGGLKADIDLASNAREKRAEQLVKIGKYDYGYEAGIGFNFYFPSFIFSPEIKFSNGLKNIHSRDPNLIYSSVLDRITSRMIVFCIHLEG